jgi:hypothetical protein
MMSIFSDTVEKFIEVFMDDFNVFGFDFDECLNHLKLVLKRCEECNLVLNWEKCHFMVQQGIVLVHAISNKGIKVDKAKIDIISRLPPHKKAKGVRSFLEHAGFYRRFIKDLSKISRPVSKVSQVHEKILLLLYEAQDSIIQISLNNKSILHAYVGQTHSYKEFDKTWINQIKHHNMVITKAPILKY